MAFVTVAWKGETALQVLRSCDTFEESRKQQKQNRAELQTFFHYFFWKWRLFWAVKYQVYGFFFFEVVDLHLSFFKNKNLVKK